MVLVPGAVDAHEAAILGELVVVGADGAGVAEGAEGFRGIKTATSGEDSGAGALAVPAGADGLGGVFQDEEAVFFGDLVDGFAVVKLAEEIDGDDGAGLFGDFFGDFGWVDVEGVGLDVDEDGFGAEPGDAAGGG